MSAADFKQKGNDAFKAQNWDLAIEMYSKAIELNPTDHVLYSNRSGGYASKEEYDKALEDASKCVEIKPDWAKGYQRKGLAQFYLKDYDNSIETYEAGLKIDPSNAALKEGLNRAKNENSGASFNDNPMLAQAFKKLQNNPKTAAYLQDQEFMMKLKLCASNPQMMMIFAQQDPRMQEAMQVMMGGMDPNMFKNMQGGAGGFEGFRGGNADFYKQAQETANQAPKQEEPKREAPKPKPKEPEEEKKPEPPKELDNADKLKNKGNEFYKKKDFAKALEFYDQAIEQKPTEILFYNNKAAAHIELGQIEEALEDVNTAIQIAEDNMIFDFVKRGKIYARKGACLAKLNPPKIDEAIEWYQKSLIEENVASVQDAKKRLEKMKKEEELKKYLSPELAEKASEEGKVLFKEGNYPAAMQKYQEATKRDPTQAKYYFNRGICYTKLMEWFHALQDFNKCLELDPEYNKAYLKKGNCHVQMKEFHKAIPAYQDGLKKDPNNEELKQALQRAQYSSMSSGNEEDQQQRYQHAMKDPEIQQILQTPEIQNALKSMQADPRESMKIMQDPSLGPKIQKLIQAGVLTTK